MNIKRYNIFPVNHQSGNEIEAAEGRYVRFTDIADLQQRLAAAEQRNATITELLRQAATYGGLTPLWHDKVQRFIKPTESGASEPQCCDRFPKCVCHEGADGL